MKCNKFNPEYNYSPGFIASSGAPSGAAVMFGGDDWRVVEAHPVLGFPAQLLTIHLYSNIFSRVLPPLPKIELPLFSYINLDGMIKLQEYNINYSNKSISYCNFNDTVELLPREDRLPLPLPEVNLNLREMECDEIPIDENTYWASVGSFLGGRGFIRILGKPVFADDYIKSNDEYLYIASIGYESFRKTSGLVKDEPFFLGEIAHYFYISNDWQRVRVIAQAT